MDFAPLTPEIQMEGLIDLQRNSHWVVKSPLDSLGHVKSEILDNAFLLKCHQLAHALQHWLIHTLFIKGACPTEGRSWSNSSTGPTRQWTDSKRLCSHHEAKRCHFRVYSYLVKGALAFKMVSRTSVRRPESSSGSPSGAKPPVSKVAPGHAEHADTLPTCTD